MNKLILIADDDEKHRKLLTDVLQAAGYTVITAENGERAIELARSSRPSLMLLDIQMPIIDGFSVVRILKADPDMRSISAIAITALAMNGDRARILSAGFDGYLSKPISLKELRAEVSRYLAGKPEQTDGATESAVRHAGDTP